MQIWRTRLHPRNGEPVTAELHVAIARNTNGRIEHLRIGVYTLSQSPADTASVTESASIASLQQPRSDSLPLDSLQVLVVDDEADIREFLTLLLESQGIGVKVS